LPLFILLGLTTHKYPEIYLQGHSVQIHYSGVTSVSSPVLSTGKENNYGILPCPKNAIYVGNESILKIL
jgi:hypothetical protein